uniref:Immunoglobulin domain-containing protein n=1 Tax=Sinocyclocheilus grahami TaxID=75366 RepID=A0A672KRU0_SINGR
MLINVILQLLLVCVSDGTAEMKRESVKEGESVTLDTPEERNPNDVMWYFNDTLITGDESKICTDEQCDERFRDRLKLDHQTGSLTITNTRTTDSGDYKLQIKSSRNRYSITSIMSFSISVTGASDVGTDTVSVFVMKGDSVTLHTNITINQRERFKWYFIDDLIAQINGDQRYICTDVKCNKEDERFRDRLKLDHQSGDLTITNINSSDDGVYRLQTFNVPADMKRKSLMEGESVTLDTPGVKKTNDVIKWYFNDTRIAEITGDQTQICEDVQCTERFKDRLKRDHQTGSLTITDTRTTDSGLYKLQIKSSRNQYSVTSIMIIWICRYQIFILRLIAHAFIAVYGIITILKFSFKNCCHNTV